jgi:hypothetical protein
MFVMTGITVAVGRSDRTQVLVTDASKRVRAGGGISGKNPLGTLGVHAMDASSYIRREHVTTEEQHLPTEERVMLNQVIISAPSALLSNSFTSPKLTTRRIARASLVEMRVLRTSTLEKGLWLLSLCTASSHRLPSRREPDVGCPCRLP